jgi:hypothetical protein
MTIPNVRELLVDSGQARPRASYRADMITVLLSLWVLVGVFLDAWAHNNLAALETFFTPWHAVLYSGFVALGGWICWIVWRGVRDGRRGIAAVPVGYGLAVLGVPLFALAGTGDYLWHTVFGIEQSLNILFSPTHLLLGVSMILIVTSPLRSAWSNPDLPAAPGLRRLLPAILSLAFPTTGVLLFLQYANALVWDPWNVVFALSNPLDGSVPQGGLLPNHLVSQIVVTSILLLAPLLLLARRWRVPAGTTTMLYAIVAALCSAITAFHLPSIIVTLLVSGVLVDALLVRLVPTEGRRGAFLAFGALAPLVTWSVYLAVASVGARHLPAVVEYWTGIPVVTALLGLVLAVLMQPNGSAQNLDRVADRDRPGAFRDQVDAEERPLR